MRQVRVKRRGKSSPLSWRQERHGKPHPDSDLSARRQPSKRRKGSRLTSLQACSSPATAGAATRPFYYSCVSSPEKLPWLYCIYKLWRNLAGFFLVSLKNPVMGGFLTAVQFSGQLSRAPVSNMHLLLTLMFVLCLCMRYGNSIHNSTAPSTNGSSP
jgi:hypothetical protein